MHATKEAALLAGERKYATGKPCRAGHYSPRYTSSGSCIECMNIVAAKNKVKNLSLKRKANAKNFSDFPEFYTGRFPLYLHPTLEALQVIFQGNDTMLQQNIIAAIRGKPATWDRDAFLRAGVIFNGFHITNAQQFPLGNPFAIQIGGIWWPGQQLIAVLRGDLPNCSPCDYIPIPEVTPP